MSLIFNPLVLLLAPRSISYGFFLSFFMNVYPTTLQFCTELAVSVPLLTAYYAIAFGLGGLTSMFFHSE